MRVYSVYKYVPHHLYPLKTDTDSHFVASKPTAVGLHGPYKQSYRLKEIIIFYHLHYFDQRRVDIIDQVELWSPRQITHIPPVWDILLPGRRYQRLLVSLPKDTGKVG